jgi:quinoprotein glucose dehydrogenase
MLMKSRVIGLLASATVVVGSLVGAWLAARAAPRTAAYTTWSDYGGSPDSMQYSALSLINKTNVSRLELAWHYPVPDRTGNFGFNPIVVDGVMYVLGEARRIVALDAATGTVVWRHDVEGEGSPGNRGINYWESKDRSDRRLIYAAGGALRAIDARTGRAVTSFGDNGRVVMRVGAPRVLGGPSGTPGRVFENLFITGSNTGERYFSPPGDIRAYDVVTGRLVWTFHTIPRPGEYGYDTWPRDGWKYAGGANCWGEISIDTKRGTVFVPTGSPTHDPYGGDRKGANLFGNTLLALDARTGKRLWHFQIVHHDLWDYDLTAAPKLLTVRHHGRPVDVVAQPTKHGLLFVFDRVTGKPLWPIEERVVPKSDVPGEEAWPTQPFPTQPAPFARLAFKPDDINPHLTAQEKEQVVARLVAARNEGVFTPPTLDREQIILPGQFGGANWGASAADPTTGMLYVRTTDHPTIHRLREFDPNERSGGGPPEERGRATYQRLCVSCHGEPQASGIRTMDRTAWIAVRELDANHVRTQIREGQGQMPAFAQDVISDDDLRGLLMYLGTRGASVAGGSAGDGPADEHGDAPPPLSARELGLTLYTGPRYTGPFGSAFRAKSGMSAIGPPWSQVVAYDLNEGTIRWRATFGTSPALAARGITNTGNARRTWRNGPTVTAGGLIFVGSWADRTVRALDKDSGKELWHYTLNANPEGIISVFEVGGRQYVAFCASGAAKRDIPAEEAYEAWPGLASAQGYYVFALPRAAGATTQ